MSFVPANMVLCFRIVTEAVLITSDVLVVAEQYLHSIKVSASHSSQPAERPGEQAAGRVCRGKSWPQG